MTQKRNHPQRTRRLPVRFQNNETYKNSTHSPEANHYPSLSTTTIFLEHAQPQHPFESSRQKELDGLLLRGVFEYVNIDTVPPNTRIFNNRFIDTIKLPGTPHAFEKSRLVVQGYNDLDKDKILT